MRFLIMRFSSQTRFIKELYEISAVLNYAIVQQLAFFAFVCIRQLFLALRYKHTGQRLHIVGTIGKKLRKLLLIKLSLHQPSADPYTCLKISYNL